MKYLRAFSLGEMLDRSLDLYREHFKFLIGVSFLAVLPGIVFGGLAGIIAVVMGVASKNTAVLVVGGLALAVVLLLAMAAFLWGWGVQIVAVARIILGETLELNSCLREGWKHLPAYLKATLLMSLPAAGGAAVIFWPLFMLQYSDKAAPLFVVTGVVMGLALYYYIFRMSMIGQAVILENKGAAASLGRSWFLVRGNWWRVFGALMFANMLLQVLQVAFLLPLMFVPFVGNVISMLSYPLVAPVLVIVHNMIYFDLRIRKEAFDLQVLAEKLKTPSLRGGLMQQGAPAAQ